jgi:hypothetical protein
MANVEYELYRRIPLPWPWPDGDPVDVRVIDKIRPEDLFRLAQVKLEVARTQLDAVRKLIDVQHEIVSKYAKG